MRIIYKKTMQEKICKALNKADRNMRIIDHIKVTKNEAARILIENRPGYSCYGENSLIASNEIEQVHNSRFMGVLLKKDWE